MGVLEQNCTKKYVNSFTEIISPKIRSQKSSRQETYENLVSEIISPKNYENSIKEIISPKT